MRREQLLAAFTPSIMSRETLEAIFVRREPLATRVMENIRTSVCTPAKRHTLLVGPRGIGKTHLVSLVYHRAINDDALRDHILIAWLREENWDVASFLDLLQNILDALAGEYRSDALTAARTELDVMPIESAEAAAERILLDFIGDKTLLLIVENLEDLFDSIEELGQRRLRAFLQNHTNAVVLSTSPSLFYGISNHDAPFYGFFSVTHLDQLSLDDAVCLLEKIADIRSDEHLAAFLRTETGRDRLMAVRHLAGGHPRIWIFFAGILTEQTLDVLVPAFLDMLDDLTPYYQARIKELPPQQRKIVSLLCTRRGSVPVKEIAVACRLSQTATGSQLHNLREKAFVRAESVGRESWYELNEPLMRLVLEVKESRGRPIRLIVDFLRRWYSRSERRSKYATVPHDAQMTRQYVDAALDLRGFADAEPYIISTPCEWTGLQELLNAGEYDSALSIIEEDIEKAGKLVTAQHWKSHGDCLFRLMRIGEALESLDIATKLDPSDPSVLAMRAMALHALERYSEALLDIDRAIVVASEIGPLYHLRAITLNVMDRNVEALESYDRALEFDPSDVRSYTRRGAILDGMKRYAEALDNYNRAIELDPTDGWAYAHRGTTLAQLKRFSEALESYERALELDPMCAPVYAGRGTILDELGRCLDALESYDRAIELDPARDWAYAPRGFTLAKLKRYSEALESYERAIEFDPMCAPAYAGRGSVLEQLGRYADALESYDHALELDATNAWLFARRALVLSNLKSYNEALQSYDHSLELDPTNTQTYLDRGSVLDEVKRYSEALESYARAIELNPANPWGYVNRGSTLDRLGRYSDALESYDRAIELEPTNATFHSLRGYFLGVQKRYSEALESFNNVIKLRPDGFEAYICRGYVLNGLQHYSEALDSLDESLQIDSEDALARYNHAISLLGLGRWDEFMRDLRNTLPAGMPEYDEMWGYSADYCRLLLESSSPLTWSERVASLTSLYAKNQLLSCLGKGLTESVRYVFGSGSSSDVLEMWNTAWKIAGETHAEMEIPLRLLDAAIRWHKKPDRRILLGLPAEERSVLESLLPRP